MSYRKKFESIRIKLHKELKLYKHKLNLVELSHVFKVKQKKDFYLAVFCKTENC